MRPGGAWCLPRSRVCLSGKPAAEVPAEDVSGRAAPPLSRRFACATSTRTALGSSRDGRTSVRAGGPLSGSSRDGRDFGARGRTALGVIARARWAGLRCARADRSQGHGAMGRTSVRASGPLSGSWRDGWDFGARGRTALGVMARWVGLRCARADRSRGHGAMGGTSVRAGGPLSGSSRDGSDFGPRGRTALGVIARWVGLRCARADRSRGHGAMGGTSVRAGGPLSGSWRDGRDFGARERADRSRGHGAMGGTSVRAGGPLSGSWRDGRDFGARERTALGVMARWVALRSARADRSQGHRAMGGTSVRASGPPLGVIARWVGLRSVTGLVARARQRPGAERRPRGRTVAAARNAFLRRSPSRRTGRVGR